MLPNILSHRPPLQKLLISSKKTELTKFPTWCYNTFQLATSSKSDSTQKVEIEANIAVADLNLWLRGREGHILSISCSFFGKFGKIVCWHTPPHPSVELASPSRANPGSATVLNYEVRFIPHPILVIKTSS